MEHKSISLLPLKAKLGFDGSVSDISTTSPFGSMRHELFGASSTLSHKAGLEDIEAKKLRQRVEALHNPISPAALLPVLAGARIHKTIEERLFDATAGVKIFTSQVAMHLDKEWRNKLFQQLDSLHAPEEWDPEDEPIQRESFATFLKAIILIKPTVRPGLGLSHGGHLIAAWTSGKNRLTIEFMPNDRVRWVASRYPEGELEQFAGQTQVSRLLTSLGPYSPDEWLFDAK